jgi:hypothetical protein
MLSVDAEPPSPARGTELDLRGAFSSEAGVTLPTGVGPERKLASNQATSGAPISMSQVAFPLEGSGASPPSSWWISTSASMRPPPSAIAPTLGTGALVMSPTAYTFSNYGTLRRPGPCART